MKMIRSFGGFIVFLLVTGMVPYLSAVQAFETGSAQLQQGDTYFQYTPDGEFRVYESTFNELAAAVLPLEVSGAQPQRIVQTIGWCPACFTVNVEICSGEWDAEVTGLVFDITNDHMRVSGTANANYHCVIPMHFSTEFSTDVQVDYDRNRMVLTVATDSEPIPLTFDAPVVGSINLLSIDPGPSLTLPPIPVTTTRLGFETAKGPSYLVVDSYNISLNRREGEGGDGYVEVKGKVNVW